MGRAARQAGRLRSLHYRLNGARVLCNPRGYALGGVDENRLFEAGFVADLS
ncbi:MAG TPA: hypothetical protein VEB41_10080 [Burkholderiales bacterium]|nr:hypothetical protein [Burkholderiales bacterium]